MSSVTVGWMGESSRVRRPRTGGLGDLFPGISAAPSGKEDGLSSPMVLALLP